MVTMQHMRALEFSESDNDNNTVGASPCYNWRNAMIVGGVIHVGDSPGVCVMSV